MDWAPADRALIRFAAVGSGAATPSTLRSAVLNGIITRSSWSWPIARLPLGDSRPITRIGTPLTRIIRADRFSPSPNRFC